MPTVALAWAVPAVRLYNNRQTQAPANDQKGKGRKVANKSQGLEDKRQAFSLFGYFSMAQSVGR